MNGSSRRVLIDPVNPPSDIIIKAAHIIKQGGMVVFPTRCIYGLGGNALNPRTVDNIYRIKQRPRNKPVSILITEVSDLEKLTQNIPETAYKIMNAFWPGKITLVFKAGNHLPRILSAGTQKIGVRLVEHPVARALINAAVCPLTGTSANISSRDGCSRIGDLDTEIASGVDMILDAGPLAGGRGSTIVDVTRYRVTILREGAVPKDKILTVSQT